jgi:hypothetical protein
MNSLDFSAMPFSTTSASEMPCSGGELAHVLRDFHRAKCGPHMLQKCAVFAESWGKVSS